MLQVSAMTERNDGIMKESKDSKELKNYLIQKGCLCVFDDDNSQQRLLALEMLENLVNDWASRHSLKPTVAPVLVTFGSYRLGAHRRDSDIDVLTLFPDNVTREEFFSGFAEHLAKDKRVSKLLSIKNAFTPVIKFYLNGVHLDVLFGNVADSNKLVEFHNTRRQAKLLTSANSINRDWEREEYTIEDADLSGMDQPGVRSLNGVRVTQFIEQGISNMESFRICLSAIKEWAVLHGVYSNQMGFLGGINFAILLAKVFIDYPESESLPPSAILKVFFRTYALWEWPEPVILNSKVQQDPPAEVQNMKVWTQDLNFRDILPIITPSYPAMNSSYNVGLPQKRRIQEEMIRSALLLEQEEGWIQLLKETDFFTRHSNFLQIIVSSNNADDYQNWLPFCQSKVRLLITALETQQTSAWPFAKFFDHGVDGESMGNNKDEGTSTIVYQSSFFVALRFAPTVDKVNLKQNTSQFLHQINSWEERKAGMDLNVRHVLQNDLPAFVLTDSTVVETISAVDNETLTISTRKRPRLSES